MVVLLILYELVVGFIATTLQLNALAYTFLSWIIPSMFFFYKLPALSFRYLREVIIWTIPLSMFFDYMGHTTHAWSFWGNPKFTSTGIRVLGIPIESLIWIISYVVFTLVVYEFFFDTHRTQKNKKTEKTGKAVLIIPYYYTMLIMIFGMVGIVLLRSHREVVHNAILCALLMGLLGLIEEYFSLRLGLWAFPGSEFLMRVNFMGFVIPIEEILWWFVMPLAGVAIHETFSDAGD